MYPTLKAISQIAFKSSSAYPQYNPNSPEYLIMIGACPVCIKYLNSLKMRCFNVPPCVKPFILLIICPV